MNEEKTDDLFGKLPNEIICKIISFLPSESSLETSLISSRWRGLWNTNLSQQVTSDGVADAVLEFLSHFDKLDPLRHPRRLILQFGKDSDLLLATIAANNKLHLEFSTEKQEVHQRLFCWQLQLHYQRVQKFITHQPCPSTFFVKTLYLKSVTYISNEVVSSVISSFAYLENLNIIECDGLQSLHIESSPKLLSLTILDCPQLKSLHLRTSKLRSFRYRGFLPRIWLEHHFNLADAMLDFRQGPGYTGFRSSDFDPILFAIKNAQVLTLCKWTFQILIWPSLLPLETNFIFYKLKELRWIENWEEIYSDALFSFLKLCPALEQLFVTNDPKSYCMASTALYSKKIKSHTKLDLKLIKLEGFAKQDDEASLTEHIRDIVIEEPLIIAAASSEN